MSLYSFHLLGWCLYSMTSKFYAGSQGKHWIRLELQPDILITTLKMKVDPADSSYMPSLVQVLLW